MGRTAFRWRGRAALALSAWLAAAGTAAAGSFGLAPVRVEFDKGRTTSVLTLHNEADAPVTIQIESVAWSQPDNTDRYEPTRDLIVTPPVFVVPPKSDQIIRIARRSTADTGREIAYRLFFNEVPDSTPLSGTGLKVALRIGVPVFVTSPGASADLRFTAEANAAGGVELTATNSGRAHVQISDFEVTGGGDRVVGEVKVSRYLLAGASAHWTLTPAGGETPSGVLKVHGHSDRGDIAVEVALPAR
jgi:fimbrial chaperone protein